MKRLLSIFLVGLLSTSIAVACDHDKEKEPVKNEAPKNADKAATPAAEVTEGEVKEVCVEINGKKKCKKMKMHKKFEGTAIPPAKKK